MAAGKTTIGEALAERLGWRFIDLDRVIEELERATVTEIFNRSGQAIFRNSETAALERVLQSHKDHLVLALGGGAYVRRENQELLRGAQAHCIFLNAPADELWRRATYAGAPERPLLRDRTAFDSLFASRLPEYRRAKWEISTSGKTVEQTTIEIEKRLRNEDMA